MALPDFPNSAATIRPGVKLVWLLMGVAGLIVLWRVAGDFSMRIGPDAGVMESAADTMRRATAVLREARRARTGPVAAGAASPDAASRDAESADTDPVNAGFDGPVNAGFDGPEWTEPVTTVRSAPAKRTLVSAHTAAVFSRLLREAGLRRGDTVAVVLSGAYVGASVAVLSAIESYGLRTVVVSSLGAPVAGADDPGFAWLDLERTLREAGVWRMHSIRALIGADASVASRVREPGDALRAGLLASARRANVPLIESGDFAAAVNESAAVMGLGPNSDTRPAALVNIGASRLALGECLDPVDVPYGLSRRPLVCHRGAPGLMQIALDQGVPVLNAFKFKEFVGAGAASPGK